ncbi:MAG: hypothetical protein M1839_001445 [Geoglossum umbratile]|nr:MAG: hypothetical protein M1839_001445 [Geoglossum umbratile]
MNLSRVWELSQNIDRFTDTTPFGVTGCVTPTGVPFITTRGGPMIGHEALAMQGLPIERLLLTREHQRQLQDLAGNAMSTTVVGATILGSLIVGYEPFEPGYGDKTVIDASEDVTEHIRGVHHHVEDVLDLATFKETPVASVLQDARRSSRLCLCEGRALITPNWLQ